VQVSTRIVERPSSHRPGLWAGFVVPDDVVSEIAGAGVDDRKRLPVVVSLGDAHYRSSITRQPDGWEFIASLQFRAETGAKLGDAIHIDIALDTSERDVEPPSDVEQRLDEVPGLREWWEGLAYSHKRELMLYIDDAKRPETRARRIDAMVRSYTNERDSMRPADSRS